MVIFTLSNDYAPRSTASAGCACRHMGVGQRAPALSEHLCLGTWCPLLLTGGFCSGTISGREAAPARQSPRASEGSRSHLPLGCAGEERRKNPSVLMEEKGFPDGRWRREGFQQEMLCAAGILWLRASSAQHWGGKHLEGLSSLGAL